LSGAFNKIVVLECRCKKRGVITEELFVDKEGLGIWSGAGYDGDETLRFPGIIVG
jgi:hypothetical protein